MHPRYDLIRNHPHVNQSRALTDRSKYIKPHIFILLTHFLVWNNIRADIVENMASIQQRRVEAERHTILRERCRVFQKVYWGWHARQSDKRVLPRAIDLMRRPEVEALITAGNEVPVTTAAFTAFTSQFARWAAAWKAECDEKLRDLVRRSPAFADGIPTGVDPLSLARVVFTCTKCKNRSPSPENARVVPLYPTILTHDCLYEEVWESKMQDAFDRAAVAVSQTKNTFGKHTFWSCEPLEVDSWAMRADKIIAAFGRKPMTVTRDEMDTIGDARIYCYQCPLDSVYHRNVMTWRHAVSPSCQSGSPL